MYKYSDTLGFDLAVVVFVVGVMPLAVFLMQSKRRLARATALALMFAAVAYVAVFEHYRLHRPEVTDLGLKRAVVPESVLDFVEARLEERERASRERRFLKNQLAFAEIAILPVAADEDIVRAACAEVAASPNVSGVEPEPRAFPFGKKQTVPRKAGTGRELVPVRSAAVRPLMVHLSHRGAGDRFFADALSALERETCGDAREDDVEEEEEDVLRARDTRRTPTNSREENANADAHAPASSPEVTSKVSARARRRLSRSQCAPRRVVPAFPAAASSDALSDALDASGASENVFITFESPSRADASLRRLRAAATSGKPYRAVFFVRDPRDVVTRAYLDRVGRRRMLDRPEHADHVESVDGIDREIDAFTSAAAAANLGLVPVLGNGLRSFRSTFTGPRRSTRDARDGIDDMANDGIENDPQPSDSATTFATSLRAFAALSDENVRFVRYEDLLVASRAGFELLGRWFGLRDGAELDAFADACVREQEKTRGQSANESEKSVPPGTWRGHFTAQNAKRFDEAHGTLLRSLGYLDSGTNAESFVA